MGYSKGFEFQTQSVRLNLTTLDTLSDYDITSINCEPG